MLSLIVLVPIGALSSGAPASASAESWRRSTDPRVSAALRLSFGSSLVAAAVQPVFGLALAWVLVRYRFPGSA